MDGVYRVTGNTSCGTWSAFTLVKFSGEYSSAAGKCQARFVDDLIPIVI